MKGKLALIVGGAVGYVLGTRAGKERYEQIKTQAGNVWRNPTVRQKASQAQHAAMEKAPEVKDKVADAASRVTGGGSDNRDTTPPSETYPRADHPTGGVGP